MPHAKTLFAPLTLVLCFLATGCNRGGAPAAAAAPPPAKVPTVTLQEKPVEQASEFIAQLRSQRSSTIQPEIDGVVTRIMVKPGDRVRVGSPLVQINAEKQRAAVRSTEANRGGLEADVTYWREQVKRLEALVGAGAISRQEFDQAQNSLRSAESRLAAVDAQVREGRVELNYYRVNSPQAGIVGDITLRVGDRVTPSTVITTIDDNSALEADIQVPLNRAAELRLGLPVQMLDAAGKPVATNPITFVAPRVDERTQTVLVKSVLREAPPAMRTQQFSRARIVWSNTPGLTVPITAVVRINGLYFCFLAEQTDKGTVARQRPIEVGELVGNDYVVRSGLKPGDRIITSGVQKLGNGAPVQPE